MPREIVLESIHHLQTLENNKTRKKDEVQDIDNNTTYDNVNWLKHLEENTIKVE